ncbi:ATP dependent DNA ligase domain protein [Mycobacterium ulcerans str. Harvey]|uniref:ATP dependent DNA ligase domain protein n=1 Tax=Mycobacterium ulcerans str. Harvey TaxID=1299332 RepID=A0ABP3A0Z5_MYCUL|nr:ATP dependent DNA ligase domain protein [Mycobacterium ulcerans str. Harvey]
MNVAAAQAKQPLSVFFFDILHRDGRDLLDAPTTDRLAALDAVCGPAPSRSADHRRRGRGDRFLRATLAAGHEGVMAKSPTGLPGGRRGADG